MSHRRHRNPRPLRHHPRRRRPLRHHPRPLRHHPLPRFPPTKTSYRDAKKRLQAPSETILMQVILMRICRHTTTMTKSVMITQVLAATILTAEGRRKTSQAPSLKTFGPAFGGCNAARTRENTTALSRLHVVRRAGTSDCRRVTLAEAISGERPHGGGEGSFVCPGCGRVECGRGKRGGGWSAHVHAVCLTQ